MAITASDSFGVRAFAHRVKGPRYALLGRLYATPTALFVIVLFIIPVLLVFQMTGSDWPLFTGNQGWNIPSNYQHAVTVRLFWESTRFTLVYTVITTVFLLLLSLVLSIFFQ